MTVQSPYLTSQEVVAYLRLGSLSALYSHIRENKLPYARVGRHLRFDTRELDAWMRGYESALERTRSERRSHAGDSTQRRSVVPVNSVV